LLVIVFLQVGHQFTAWSGIRGQGQDNLGRELPTLERSRLHHRTCSPSASLAVFLLEQAQDRKSATEPVSVHMARLEEQFATAFLQIEIQLG
jgi:hypothetical protein